MKKIIFWLIFMVMLLRIYIEYNTAIGVKFSFLKFPFLEILLLMAMFWENGRRTNGYILFAFISNFLGGYTINHGTTMDEKTLYFFTGMAFYFALHLNLILYFTQINPGWKSMLKSKPVRLVVPLAWWLIAFFLVIPNVPKIGIVPVLLYCGIYVLLIANAWNLDTTIKNKIQYFQLLAGVVLFLISDTLLGIVIYGQISGKIIPFPNMFSAVSTWTAGVFLVFYSLIYIQKDLVAKE